MKIYVKIVKLNRVHTISMLVHTNLCKNHKIFTLYMGVCRELLKNLKILPFQWAYTGNYNEKKLYHIIGATREVITKIEF